jgi:hypothetical protein
MPALAELETVAMTNLPSVAPRLAHSAAQTMALEQFPSAPLSEAGNYGTTNVSATYSLRLCLSTDQLDGPGRPDDGDALGLFAQMSA